MALKFINTNNTGATIKFVSSQDFPLGSPVYYKQIGFGNYTLSGNSGNKTASITSASALTSSYRNLFFNFSDINIPSSNYFSNIGLNGTSLSVTGINTEATASGTVNFYDYELGNSSENQKYAQYVISKKQSATPNSYTAIKIGEINIPALIDWNSLKDYSESYSGLTPGQDYYLSSNNNGKIVNFKTNVKLFTAISRTKAFVNLNTADIGIQTNQSIIRETFTGTGSQYIYTLAQIPTSIDTTTVFINGLFQIPGDAFTLTNNVITFSGFPPSGSKITIQYLKQYLFTGYDLYSTRKEYSLTVNNEVSLSFLFLNQESAQYRFFDISNPTISGIISLKNNGLSEPLVRVDTNSDDVTITANTSSKLNIYLKLDNLVYFQNKTLNTVNLRIYKEI